MIMPSMPNLKIPERFLPKEEEKPAGPKKPNLFVKTLKPAGLVFLAIFLIYVLFFLLGERL